MPRLWPAKTVRAHAQQKRNCGSVYIYIYINSTTKRDIFVPARVRLRGRRRKRSSSSSSGRKTERCCECSACGRLPGEDEEEGRIGLRTRQAGKEACAARDGDEALRRFRTLLFRRIRTSRRPQREQRRHLPPTCPPLRCLCMYVCMAPRAHAAVGKQA